MQQPDWNTPQLTQVTDIKVNNKVYHVPNTNSTNNTMSTRSVDVNHTDIDTQAQKDALDALKQRLSQNSKKSG